jgi:hypothetical protein
MSKLRTSNTQIRIWFVTLFALLLSFGTMVQLTHVLDILPFLKEGDSYRSG